MGVAQNWGPPGPRVPLAVRANVSPKRRGRNIAVRNKGHSNSGGLPQPTGLRLWLKRGKPMAPLLLLGSDPVLTSQQLTVELVVVLVVLEYY